MFMDVKVCFKKTNKLLNNNMGENFDKTNEKLQKELEKFKSLAEEYLNGWKRAKADLINFQKEIERQKEEWIEFSNSNLILMILPIYESIERLLHSASNTKEVKEDFFEGIKCIKNQFDDFFKKIGVKKIKTVGEVFDPIFHESVGSRKADNASIACESGKIVEEIQSGYLLHDKVLRPAKVIVLE